VVICPERGADCLHIDKLMPLHPRTKPHRLLPHLNPDWFYLSGIAYPGCPGKQAVKGCRSSR